MVMDGVISDTDSSMSLIASLPLLFRHVVNESTNGIQLAPSTLLHPTEPVQLNGNSLAGTNVLNCFILDYE